MNLRKRIIKAPIMKMVKTKKQDRLKHVEEIINNVIEQSRLIEEGDKFQNQNLEHVINKQKETKRFKRFKLLGPFSATTLSNVLKTIDVNQNKESIEQSRLIEESVRFQNQDRLEHIEETINNVIEQSRLIEEGNDKFQNKPISVIDKFFFYRFTLGNKRVTSKNMWYVLAKTNAKFSVWYCWYRLASVSDKLDLLNIIRTWNQDMCENGHVTREYFMEEENCLPRVMLHFYNYQHLEIINYIWFNFDNFENLLSGVMANGELKKYLIDLDYNMARVAAKFGKCLYDEHIMYDIGDRQIMGVTCVDGYEETASKIYEPLRYRAINISESIDATVMYRIGQYFKITKHKYNFKFDTKTEERKYYDANIKNYFKHLSPETKEFLNRVFVSFRFGDKLVWKNFY